MNFITEENKIYCLNGENKVIAEITYEEVEKNVYNINHTFVDESLRGKKIGQTLVEMAIKEIKSKNGKITATCSYAKHYLEKNSNSIKDTKL